jgi:hypothetical protein
MDKNTEDLAWGIGIVILLITLWVTSGGIQRSSKEIVDPTVKGGNSSVKVTTQKTPFFSQFYTYSPDVPAFENGASYSPSTISNGTGGSGGTGSNGANSSVQTYYELPSGIAKAQLSPYAGKVNLQSGSAGSSKAENEYVSIEAASNNTERIPITNWLLVSSKSGARSSIGQGTGLPYTNQLNAKETIYLAPGDTAYIITGRSPINVSFRLNVCTGYFQQFNRFTPPLFGACPALRDVPVPPAPNNFNDACEDYISGYPSCNEVTQPLPSYLTHECQVFITEESRYDKCVDRNKNKPGFYKKEWRVYLSRDSSLWKSSRESITLYDAQGKIVDTLSY